MFPAVAVLAGSLNPLRGIQAEIQGLQIQTLRGIQQKAVACPQSHRRAGARWRIYLYSNFGTWHIGDLPGPSATSLVSRFWAAQNYPRPFKMSPDASKTLQDACRRGHDAAKTTPRPRKIRPRAPQEPPGSLK